MKEVTKNKSEHHFKNEPEETESHLKNELEEAKGLEKVPPTYNE